MRVPLVQTYLACVASCAPPRSERERFITSTLPIYVLVDNMLGSGVAAVLELFAAYSTAHHFVGSRRVVPLPPGSRRAMPMLSAAPCHMASGRDRTFLRGGLVTGVEGEVRSRGRQAPAYGVVVSLLRPSKQQEAPGVSIFSYIAVFFCCKHRFCFTTVVDSAAAGDTPQAKGVVLFRAILP